MYKYIFWGRVLHQAVIEADTIRMRTTAQGLKPFVMTNLKTQAGLTEVIAFIEKQGMLAAG